MAGQLFILNSLLKSTGMIKRLSNKEPETANSIYSVFQVSYAVEAKLLRATNFPPLQRKPEGFINSDNDFFGYFQDQELAAVIEIDHKEDSTHIQSLVVDPKFFRQGIGRKLVEFVFDIYKTNLFTVETGAENGPATQLYRKYGFIEIKQYETDHGIRKVRFEKRISS